MAETENTRIPILTHKEHPVSLNGLKTFWNKAKEEIAAIQPMTSVTWAELKEMRDNAELKSGQQYRITDYVTTTTQDDTRSAGHPFDVIVTADSNNALNEVARVGFPTFNIERYKNAHSGTLGEDMSYIGLYEYEDKEYHLYESRNNTQMLVDFTEEFNFKTGVPLYPFEAVPTFMRQKYNDIWGEWEEGAIASETINFNASPNSVYFHDAEAKLETWKIWYCLDNDVERFAWADVENGKGVIYRMIDEWNNDCPYDFKNIMFKRRLNFDKGYAEFSEDGEETWVYTFAGQSYHIDNDEWSGMLDGSLESPFGHMSDIESSTFHDNTIKPYIKVYKGNEIYTECGIRYLNDIVFLGYWEEVGSVNDGDAPYYSAYCCYNNSFENDCYNNSFGNYCHSNSFGNYCHSNSFGNDCYYNSFGNYCHSNSFGNDCYSNSFGNYCYNNSFGNYYHSNSFGNDCYNNSFGNKCHSNSFGNDFRYNSFGNDCYDNSFGNGCHNNNFHDSCSCNTFENGCYDNYFYDSCSNNTFGNDCYSNSFENNCYNNSFGNECTSTNFGNHCKNNSFGNGCYNNRFEYICNRNSFGNGCNNNSLRAYCYCNTFENGCSDNSFDDSCCYNSFGNNCYFNTFGIYCSFNSFGNQCGYNSFRSSASKTASLKSYCQYNHFDDGCSCNVIWNSSTTSSSNKLQNININRGVYGTESKYNFINIDNINSEKEINVINYNGHIYIDYGDAFKVTYTELSILKYNSKLIPGRQYRIIDYNTTTSQENTTSAEHQFDIIVTAINESDLSEEAQAIQNINDGYFDDSNLSAWKIWYSLYNDTDRFAWAGDERIETTKVEKTVVDSSECIIKSELINGNTFITPFNFESCVWVDGDGDGVVYDDGGSNHDKAELVYEWGYFTDENDNTHLCLYKSDAGLYEEEGQPDYGDKYLYRGVVNVDGTDYDYWQKWDANGDGLDVQCSGDYVFATTPRIVANPESYLCETTTETIETVIQLQPKGVIYRMIDEFGNDLPYDFKNIKFKHPNDPTAYSDYYYTFSTVINGVVTDHSLLQGYCYSNTMKAYITSKKQHLNSNVFLNASKTSGCYSNSFRNYCYKNSFGNGCYSNSFGYNCNKNSFGNVCNENYFGNECLSNSFGNSCSYNSFGNKCCNNYFKTSCGYNFFGNDCSSNSFGPNCKYNSFGNSCDYNSFGSDCYRNSFGNNCEYNSFRVSANTTASLKNYVHCNHFDDGCSYNVIWNIDTTASNRRLQNINVNRGVLGTVSSYNMINITTIDQDYEIQVAKNSKGEIKIYCEADLIA